MHQYHFYFHSIFVLTLDVMRASVFPFSWRLVYLLKFVGCGLHAIQQHVICLEVSTIVGARSSAPLVSSNFFTIYGVLDVSGVWQQAGGQQ